MQRSVTAICVLCLAMALGAARAHAQEGETENARRRDYRKDKREDVRERRRDMRGERRDARKEVREERRDARKEVREERRDARKEVREERRDAREEVREERHEAREERRDERKDAREHRRDERKDARDERREHRRDRREARREHRRELLRRLLVSSFGPDRGPAGTQVVIRGRNFAPGLSVHLGGIEVKAEIKPDRIVFKVPKGAADGALVIRGPGGDHVVGRFDTNGKHDRAEWKKRRDERRARAQARWKERQDKLAKTIEERRAAAEARREERRKDREERRRRRAEELKAKWERAFLAAPEVQAELTLHAQRTARLQHMLELAGVEGHAKLGLRIEILIDREDERHQRRMDLLKATLKI